MLGALAGTALSDTHAFQQGLCNVPQTAAFLVPFKVISRPFESTTRILFLDLLGSHPFLFTSRLAGPRAAAQDS